MNKQTKKRNLYFDQVMKMHNELGYSARLISRILPLGHNTVSVWIRTFAEENKRNRVLMGNKKDLKKSPVSNSLIDSGSDLTQEVARLRAQLKEAEFRADVYDEMINVAESKFNIPIRKKVGAKRY